MNLEKKIINLVWMIANQNINDICFTYFILQAKGQSFSGPNIRLRPKVKIVPMVQHCLLPSEGVLGVI